MTGGLFIKVDTSFFENPKVLAAGERAAVMFLNMLCYSKANLSDGFVPSAMVPRFGLDRPQPRLAALVSTELIEEVPGGYRITGWDDRNRTRAQVEQIREKRREAGAKGGRPRKQPETNLLTNPEPNGNQIASTPENPEFRVQSSEFRELPPPTSDSRPAPDSAEVVAVDLADQLVGALGYATPELARADERRYVAKALTRGWTAEQLLDVAVEAASRDVDDPRQYLLGALRNRANRDPSRAVAASAPGGERRPLLDDERAPCARCGASGWVDVDGGGVERCPDCTGVRT